MNIDDVSAFLWMCTWGQSTGMFIVSDALYQYYKLRTWGECLNLLFFNSKTFLEYGTIKWSFHHYFLIWRQGAFSNVSAVKASVLNSLGAFTQCRRDSGGVWEEAGTNYRDPAIQKGAWGPTKLYMFFFCLFRYYLYLLIVQNNPFRPSPSPSATGNQSFRFNMKIFRQSALAEEGGSRKSFFVFLLGAEPLSPRPCFRKIAKSDY